jgi:polar amino acid transport system substrate-binding protein
VNQAVVALKNDKAAKAASVADLKKVKLGAQVGTTSLSYIQDVVAPEQQPSVFDDTNAAKAALNNGQIDGIVVDLPTAFYLTAAEIENSVVVGQFPAQGGKAEEFGLLFEKGSPLVSCVDTALAALKSSGKLQQIQDEWLSQKTDVPVLK